MTYAVVRVRGTIDVHPKIKDTLKMLRLHRPNHCVLVPEDPSFEGMLQAVKDHATWGEVDGDTLADVLSARGKVTGDDPLTDEHVGEHTEFGSLAELAEAIADGKARLDDVAEAKPVIRLHPPSGGFEGTKRPFGEGGALGYRAEAINDLLARMVGP